MSKEECHPPTAEETDVRLEWERPELRILAAEKAEGGGMPCNDGGGGGCGPPDAQHS